MNSDEPLPIELKVPGLGPVNELENHPYLAETKSTYRSWTFEKETSNEFWLAD